jgi:hypothetical protein
MTIFNAELHAGRTRNTFLDAHPELYSLLCRIAPRTRSKTSILFQNHLVLGRSSQADVSAQNVPSFYLKSQGSTAAMMTTTSGDLFAPVSRLRLLTPALRRHFFGA